MNQALNIFRKDTAQMWAQLLMPMSTLTLFTVLESKSWSSNPLMFFSTDTLTNVLVLTFCMIWVVLIISLIQAERLVGLNQFWTTRPYEWPKLIAAKCCFLLTFLYFPLVVSQVILLHQAHLSIAQSVPALLHNLLVFTVVFVLPVVCAAALTRSIGRAMLVLLVFVAMLVAVASFPTLFKGLAPRSLLPLQLFLIAAVLSAALINQYRNRTTGRSLNILILAPVLTLLLQVTVPGTSLAAYGYPLPTGSSSVSVQFDSNPLRAFGTPLPSDPDARLYLHLPLLLSGIEPGTSFALDGHRLTLIGANGYQWQSPWLSQAGALSSSQSSGQITAFSEFSIPRSVYDRLAGSPVSLRIEFALTQLQDQPPVGSTLSTVGTRIRGLGFCLLDESYSVVNCRSAFHAPSHFAIETFRKLGPCTLPDAVLDPAFGLVGDAGSVSMLPHISSVDVTPLQLGAPTRAGNLCPGMPIKFVEKRFQRRLEIEMPAVTIALKDYVGSTKIK
ncbi:MAG: hypothetical protein ABSG84_17305 [Acidobacteriaceae bacterium]|jgi:hypothetical protein